MTNAQTTHLAGDARRLHRRFISAMVETGALPLASELVSQLRLSEAAIHDALRTLAAADYLALDDRGQVTCLYPFSVTPSAHVVRIDGQPRFAMCAIDALGLPAMLVRECEIVAHCAVCHSPIALRVRPATLMRVTPPDTMVVARRDEREPAFAACCPFTVFVCGQAHAAQFMRRVAGTRALTLSEALAAGEQIFAGLLAASLPAKRPRGMNWER